MHEAAQALRGEHDFTSFRSSGCKANHAVREVLDVAVSREDDRVTLDIEANGFLYHMVRNIAGSLIDIGAGEQDVSWMGELLEKQDRRQAGVTAPPDGLYFMGVRYPGTAGLPTSWEPFPAASGLG